VNSTNPIRNGYTVDHPEASCGVIVGAACTALPIVADLIGASTSFGVMGAATALGGAGAITLGVTVREAPTATALCGAGALGWGSYMAVSGFVPAFASLSQLAVGVCLTGASWLAGRVVEWKRAGTPIERTKLDLERIKLAAASMPVLDAEVIESSWSPLPASSWSEPATVAATTDPIRIGTDIMLPLKGGHILVAGKTGSGKSVLLANLIADLMPRRYIRVTVIDPKGDALLAWLYDTDVTIVRTDDAADVMARHAATMRRRGDLVREWTREAKATGGPGPSSDWVPTADEPWDVIIVDEFTDLSGTEAFDHIDAVARKSRALGQTLVMATQSVSADLFKTSRSDTGGSLRAQFDTLVCGRVSTTTEVDKLFGPGMASAGWWAHKMPGKGHVLVSSADDTEPVMRRAPDMPTETFRRVVERFAGGRGAVAQGPLRKALSAPVAPVPDPVDQEPEVFAHAVEEPPAQTVPATVKELILAHLAEHGSGRPVDVSTATTLAHGTVKTELTRMRKAGLLESDGAGVYSLPRAKSNVIEFRRR
jgi:energy-coupling factor transporter ATP-binding protein EcfA2